MIDVAAESVLTVVNGPKVFHGGVPRIDHHVAVVRVQSRVHEGCRLRGGVFGGAVVRVGSGGVHLGPVRVSAGRRRQTVACLASARRSVATGADQVASEAALTSVAGRDASARGEESAGPLLRPVAVLLHVLGQVGFLGVTLPAELADVGLEVFRLLVFGNVVEQGVLVDEALVAGVALVGLVRLVASGVRLEVGELREGFCASVVATLVRFVAGVSPDVLLQVRQLRELPLADFASEKRFPC